MKDEEFPIWLMRQAPEECRSLVLSSPVGLANGHVAALVPCSAYRGQHWDQEICSQCAPGQLGSPFDLIRARRLQATAGGEMPGNASGGRARNWRANL